MKHRSQTPGTVVLHIGYAVEQLFQITQAAEADRRTDLTGKWKRAAERLGMQPPGLTHRHSSVLTAVSLVRAYYAWRMR